MALPEKQLLGSPQLLADLEGQLHMSVDEEILKKPQLEKKAIKMPYHLSQFQPHIGEPEV
jgi:hypothetical protein